MEEKNALDAKDIDIIQAKEGELWLAGKYQWDLGKKWEGFIYPSKM